MRIYLNEGWGYTPHYTHALCGAGFDGALEPVRLPHTVAETPLHYFDESVYQMVSGYRRTLRAPEEWRGKRVLLTFEGAAHDATVFVNGAEAGRHRCGYTAFTVDLSERLRFGEDNVIAVRLDSRGSLNAPPFGFVIDYMTYGGLYRDVYLEVKEPVCLVDVYVSGQVRGGRAVAVTRAAVHGAREGLRLRQDIRRRGGTDWQTVLEKPVAAALTETRFAVRGARLWSQEDPALYEVRTKLLRDGVMLDERTVVTGFRSAEFKADGFYLNGEKVKLRGLNRHQSFPYVGYAMPASMQRLDADILKKELGVNAVRTSHYPQSHDFLERCDELGLLVFTEIPGWQYIGDEEWKEQAVKNTEDMVRQYRNHTSIILWGVRINESQDDDGLYRRTNAAARRLDPFRPTGGVRNFPKSHLLEDVYTFNDFIHDGKRPGCRSKGAVTPAPDRPYLISEYNGHMYPTKSFDCGARRTEHALRHANVLDAVAKEADIAGSFGWCMFDYNTHKDFGSGDRVCYHGVLDMFRNPKPAAAVYASQGEGEPVLEVSSSMDIGEYAGSCLGALYLFTNADSVRMYKNGRFLKEYTRDDSPYRYLPHGPILADDMVGNALEEDEGFPPAQARDVKAVLNAVARYGLDNLPQWAKLTAAKAMALYRMSYRQAVDLYGRYVGNWGGEATVYRFEAVKDGRVVKKVVKRPVTGLELHARVSHTRLREERSYDVAAVRIWAADAEGNRLYVCNDPVVLETEGPVALIGPPVISLQGGAGGTYVKTLGQAGRAVLTARLPDGPALRLDFTVEA